MIQLNTKPSVKVRGLNHFFGQGESRKQVLFDIHLDLLPGQIVIMTGPSGSGKTTLLTLIGGLRSVQEGSLRVFEREYAGMGAAAQVEARRAIGFIFQAHNLFASLTAFRNVRLALELREYPASQMKVMAETILGEVGLGQRIYYKPEKLSGGQRQRVAVARALVNRPKLVLADEPTAALDEASGKDVVRLLKRLADEDGATILVVTHDSRILGYADRIVNMVDGRIASDINVRLSVEICGFLKQCRVFQPMTPDELTEIAQRVEIVQFAAGDTIIRQGDEGDRFYIIRNGNVAVTVAGAAQPIDTMKAGDSFGEGALLTGEPRNATITALTEGELYALDKPSFQAAVASSASFGEQLRGVFFRRMSHR